MHAWCKAGRWSSRWGPRRVAPLEPRGRCARRRRSEIAGVISLGRVGRELAASRKGDNAGCLAAVDKQGWPFKYRSEHWEALKRGPMQCSRSPSTTTKPPPTPTSPLGRPESAPVAANARAHGIVQANSHAVALILLDIDSSLLAGLALAAHLPTAERGRHARGYAVLVGSTSSACKSPDCVV